MKRTAYLLVPILAACATTTAPPQEYLLRPPFEAAAVTGEQPAGITLGRVQVAPYLDQRGIVLETGEHRIEVARDHLWAEPLSQSLRQMLRSGLERASDRSVVDAQRTSADGGVVIDVNVDRLHGSLQGEVVLDAGWLLRDASTGRVLGRYRLARSTLTDRPGYDALVQAHVALLEELARAIAGTLPEGR